MKCGKERKKTETIQMTTFFLINYNMKVLCTAICFFVKIFFYPTFEKKKKKERKNGWHKLKRKPLKGGHFSINKKEACTLHIVRTAIIIIGNNHKFSSKRNNQTMWTYFLHWINAFFAMHTVCPMCVYVEIKRKKVLIGNAEEQKRIENKKVLWNVHGKFPLEKVIQYGTQLISVSVRFRLSCGGHFQMFMSKQLYNADAMEQMNSGNLN